MKTLASGPADHRALEEFIGEGARAIVRAHVDPWLHFGSSGVSLKMLDGTPIIYSGIEFDGSAHEVFWSRKYIDDYLRAFVDTVVAEISKTARALGLDVGVVLNDVGGMLDAAIGKVLDRMVVVDQRLRGKGFPDTVKPRSVADRREELRSYIARRIKVEYATELLHARTIMIQGLHVAPPLWTLSRRGFLLATLRWWHCSSRTRIHSPVFCNHRHSPIPFMDWRLRLAWVLCRKQWQQWSLHAVRVRLWDESLLREGQQFRE
ncbi:hypothetical protein MUU75_00840 [Pseudoxanthomonas mexicana]|uniref:hypothetical protein n=1 Tax=Pseudoxanthomonas mexicana TaxID=128785 RepID=UPI001FD649EC|nr:hypothetical protein [Pseudoxanthomonas mexicana]UOV05322.1 hypothetical protein MUU75_00840 [Pseudoxanthomonas mexicana]